MRQLSFVENNRPGDSRLPANRRAVRSWAARDPLGKSGQRLKRRRRRYKPPSVVYVDERALEALQHAPVPGQSELEEDESSTASSEQPPSSAFTPINYTPQSAHLPPYSTRLQTPPTLSTAHSRASSHERIFISENTPPQRANASARPSPSTFKPLEPIFVDPGKSHPRVARQHPPISIYIPGQLQTERRAIQAEVSAPHPTYWPGLELKDRTQSLGPALPPEVRPLQGVNEAPHGLPSVASPSAISEPAHRATKVRLGLPPIVPSSLAGSDTDQTPVLSSASTGLSGFGQIPDRLRTNSFTAFAIRHSNFSWSHAIHDSAAAAIVLAPVPYLALGALVPDTLCPTTANTTAYPYTLCPHSAPPAPPNDMSKRSQDTHRAFSPMELESHPIPAMGTFSRLPAEIRMVVFSLLLVSQTSGPETYGRGSGVSTAVLSTCRATHSEAVDQLYNSPHVLNLSPVRSPSSKDRQCDPLPPYHAIARMRSITLSIVFSTVNRGDRETSVKDLDAIVALSDPVALVLLRSAALRSLTLLLLNDSQRKIGANHFRLKAVTRQMKRIMFPFAHLSRGIDVKVSGFHTLDFAELFEELRDEFSGRETPIKELVEDVLGEGDFGGGGAMDCG